MTFGKKVALLQFPRVINGFCGLALTVSISGITQAAFATNPPRPTPPAANSSSNSGASSGASSNLTGTLTNLSKNELEQIQTQYLNNQIQLSPQQRLDLINNPNISPEFKQALSNNNNLTQDQSGFNNGVDIHSEIWNLNPATVNLPQLSTNGLQYSVRSGTVVCPTSGHAYNVSLYVVAFGENYTSDEISSFCQGVISDLQITNNFALAQSFMVFLPPKDRQTAARVSVSALLRRAGVSIEWEEETRFSEETERRIIVVPFQPEENTPVQAPF